MIFIIKQTDEEYALVEDCEEVLETPEIIDTTKKRVKKLQQKGAAVENLILQGVNPDYKTYCVFSEALETVIYLQ